MPWILHLGHCEHLPFSEKMSCAYVRQKLCTHPDPPPKRSSGGTSSNSSNRARLTTSIGPLTISDHWFMLLTHFASARSTSGRVTMRGRLLDNAPGFSSTRARISASQPSAFDSAGCLNTSCCCSRVAKCRTMWTILRSLSCINSDPPMLPVPHLSLSWLWAQVSLHLYIVRDLSTSGFGHGSASA
jgi:hypothetical protein